MFRGAKLVWSISLWLSLFIEASQSHDDDIRWKRVNSSQCYGTVKYANDMAEKPLFWPLNRSKALTLEQCKTACLHETDSWSRPCQAIEMKVDSSCSLAWGCDTVRPSDNYDVLVWRNITCRDDPYGMVAEEPLRDCSSLERTGKWSCLAFDADFNGRSVWVWELCPKSCKHCGIAGLECDNKTERCDNWKDWEHKGHAQLPRRPAPECRIKQDCRWCGHGWDVTEYCKDGRCFNREVDNRCKGKKNGWRLKGGGSCWSGQREERCQEPLENGHCFETNDCKWDYYCRYPNLNDQSGFRDPKYDQPKEKPGNDAPPHKPDRKPAAGYSPSKPVKEGVHPPPRKPEHEGHHLPPNEGKSGVSHAPADVRNHERALGGVCAPCEEVDCSKSEHSSEADICCHKTILKHPSPEPNRLGVLIVVLIVLAIFVFLSIVSLLAFFYIKYRRMKRELDSMHLYHEQQEHKYQGPSLAPAPARGYQPGAVVRVQPTQQENLGH